MNNVTPRECRIIWQLFCRFRLHVRIEDHEGSFEQGGKGCVGEDQLKE